MAVKTAAGYRCGGRSKTHTTYGDAVLILQPTGGALAVPGGWGQCIRTQARNANTVPAFRRSLTRAQRAPCHVAATLHTLANQRGRNRMGGPWDNSPRPIKHDTARPCAPDRPPWFGHVSECRPRPPPDYIQINIYQRPRERGPIYAQRNQAGEQPREAPAAASGGDA